MLCTTSTPGSECRSRFTHPSLMSRPQPTFSLLDINAVSHQRPRSFRVFYFISKGVRIVNFAERFGDGGGIDTDGAGLFVGVNAIEHERLNVAVEDDADEFVRFVHDWTAAIAADDVGVGNEIEWRLQIQFRLAIDPTLGQVER